MGPYPGTSYGMAISMVISTNLNPKIYRNLYVKTDPEAPENQHHNVEVDLAPAQSTSSINIETPLGKYVYFQCDRWIKLVRSAF